MTPLLWVRNDLDRLGARWALVGGHAVSVRSVPRFTKDVDLSVSVRSDADAEDLVRRLHALGYRVLQVLEHEPTGRLGTVRLAMPRSAAVEPDLDLLFASSGVEPEIVADAESIEVEAGVVVPVATRGHLIALKVLAADVDRRPQDFADLMALLERAGDDDIRVARGALELVAARGFDRGKDLPAEFDAVLRAARRRP